MLTRFTILIAIDDSEYADAVFQHGLDQATRHDAPDIHILRVVNSDEADLEHERRWLETAVGEALDNTGADRTTWRTRIHVRAGKAAPEINALAAEVDADLLVIGRFGMHGRRSIADHVIPDAPCPVLVVGSLGRDAVLEPQCPACVALRRDSDGLSWFCQEHAAPGRMRLTTLVPSTTTVRGSFY